FSLRTWNGQMPEKAYSTTLSPTRSTNRMSLGGLVCKTVSPTQVFSCAASRAPHAGKTAAAVSSTSGLTNRCQKIMVFLSRRAPDLFPSPFDTLLPLEVEKLGPPNRHPRVVQV